MVSFRRVRNWITCSFCILQKSTTMILWIVGGRCWIPLTRKARLFPFIMISHLLVYFMSFNLLYVFQHRSLSALNILQSHREFCDDFKPSVTGHPAYIPIMDLYISLRENHIGQQILQRPLGLLVCLMKHNSLPEFQFHSHRMRILERFQVISHLPFVYIYKADRRSDQSRHQYGSQQVDERFLWSLHRMEWIEASAFRRSAARGFDKVLAGIDQLSWWGTLDPLHSVW